MSRIMILLPALLVALSLDSRGGEMAIPMDRAAAVSSANADFYPDFGVTEPQHRPAIENPLSAWPAESTPIRKKSRDAEPIPEPGSFPLMALLVLVCGMLGMRRWFDRQAAGPALAPVSMHRRG